MPGFELFSDEERKEVNDVLETGVLMRYNFDGLRNNHWKALEFEKAFAEKLQVNHCQLVSSGTASLTVALASVGIGAGDEVIIPTFTFAASFEAVLSVGAIPVLADIDDTLTLCPESVENAVTSKTKCVMPVHMCGAPAQLTKLQEICKKHNLILLEDACQALGGKYNGKYLGTIGDLGCFSFDFVKTITCGEGGAIVTNNAQFAQNAAHYQDHGHDHIGNDRGAEAHPFLGYNFRISELHAAVGLAQLRKLDDILEIQKRNYHIIKDALSNIEHITFRRVPKGGEENYSFLNIFLPDAESAEAVHKKLGENGIDGCFYWFKNNWHYINGWQHLKEAKSLAKLHESTVKQLLKLQMADFSLSHKHMGRTISILIKLSWTEDEVRSRAEAVKTTILSYFNN